MRNQEFDSLALFGKHFLMLRYKIALKIRIVKVTGDIAYLKALGGEIFHGILKKLVVVGLEAYLAALLQNGLVLGKLAGVSKAALVVLSAVPGVAEVYVNAVNAVLGGKICGEVCNVCTEKDKVVMLFAVFRKKLLCRASAHPKHILLDIGGDDVYIGVFQGVLGCKKALSAAYLQIKGTGIVGKGTVPCTFERLAAVNEIVAFVKLGTCPFFLAYSHYMYSFPNDLLLTL